MGRAVDDGRIFDGVSAALFLAMLLPAVAGGSPTRVDTLGFPGLVPDEFADIDYNPAYVNSAEHIALMAGINGGFMRQKSDGEWKGDGFSDTINRNRATSYYAGTDLRLLWPVYPLSIAVRLAPQSRESHDDRDRDLLELGFTEKDHAIIPRNRRMDFQLVPGLNLGNWRLAALFGSRLSREEAMRESSTTNPGYAPSTRDGLLDAVFYTAGAGAIWEAENGSLYGLQVTCNFGREKYGMKSRSSWYDDDYAGQPYHRGISASLTPDIRLGDQSRLRLLISAGYTDTAPELSDNLAAWVYNRPPKIEYRNISNRLGAGLTLSQDDRTFWSIGLYSTGQSVNRKDTISSLYSTATTTNSSSDITQGGTVKVGVERGFLDEALFLRLGITALDFNLVVRSDRTTRDYTGTVTDRTASNGYSFGLLRGGVSAGAGIVPTDSLSIDLVFMGNDFGYRTREYAYNATSTTSYWSYDTNDTTYDINLDFTVTYAF